MKIFKIFMIPTLTMVLFSCGEGGDDGPSRYGYNEKMVGQKNYVNGLAKGNFISQKESWDEKLEVRKDNFNNYLKRDYLKFSDALNKDKQYTDATYFRRKGLDSAGADFDIFPEDPERWDVKNDKEFQNKLATLVGTVYKEKYLEEIAKKNITDAKIKKTYDELVAKAKNSKQYKVKHALFKTEDEAKAARAKIAEGTSLEDIARAESVDKLSASKGGDLGYIFPDEFVKEFADAVKTAKTGEVSQPIKTEFGWHLIKVEDSKPAEIVPFEQAKPRIEKQLGSDAIRSYVDEISKDLKIEVVKKPEPAAKKAGESEVKGDNDKSAKKPAAKPVASPVTSNKTDEKK